MTCTAHRQAWSPATAGGRSELDFGAQPRHAVGAFRRFAGREEIARAERDLGAERLDPGIAACAKPPPDRADFRAVRVNFR